MGWIGQNSLAGSVPTPKSKTGNNKTRFLGRPRVRGIFYSLAAHPRKSQYTREVTTIAGNSRASLC